MQYAKISTEGDQQTVHLPKEFCFEGTQVGIRRAGNAVVLYPEESVWDTLFDSLNEFSADFMAERNRPVEQNRVF